YREEQLALADRSAAAPTAGGVSDLGDPVAESRRFLEARRNSFPSLDDAAERLAQAVGEHEGLAGYLRARHGLKVRRLPSTALARQFGASFEQIAHRLTTLQKPGQERVPFFFIRVDPAGNISKRLDGASFPFARHGGGCPLWTVHQAFQTPRPIVTQWLELPDGQKFFSIARTV